MTTDANGVVQGVSPGGLPHFLIPFTISPGGSVQTVQQNTPQEIIQSVANLAGTLPGTRLMAPAYGLPDPTFGGVGPMALRNALAKFEPRARVTVASAPNGSGTDDVTLVVAPIGAP